MVDFEEWLSNLNVFAFGTVITCIVAAMMIATVYWFT